MATTKKKKTVEAKTPVKEQKKVDTAAIKEQKPKKETAKTNKVEMPKPEKPEMVNIFSTTYGYYRYWVKTILTEGGIAKFRFVKDEGSYNGKIAVAAGEVEKAKKVFADYKAKHPEEKEMWK
jgi:hypothetical protein